MVYHYALFTLLRADDCSILLREKNAARATTVKQVKSCIVL